MNKPQGSLFTMKRKDTKPRDKRTVNNSGPIRELYFFMKFQFECKLIKNLF